MLVANTLLEADGHSVTLCATSEDALNHIMAKRPMDLVISDLNLPDGTGLQVLWVLKKLVPDVSLILVTRNASVETAIEATNPGAFAYHVKPLDLDALGGSIRNALRQQRLMAQNKRLLESLMQSNSDLMEANLELEDNNKKLEELSLAKSQILSMVSHDLKTPLASIVGYVDRLLLQGASVGLLNEKQQTYIGAVQKSSYRLKALIEDLLDVAAIESGVLNISVEELDVEQEVLDSLKSMQDHFTERAIQIEVEIPDGIPRVKADRVRLSQVITNLLSNACKYSPSGAMVTVTARDKPGFVQIDFSDSGPGIPEEDRSMIFTKFFRVRNPSTSEASGAGLGLYICRHIMEMFGGKIWVNSQERQGSTFSLVLPTADQAPVKPVSFSKGIMN